MINWCCVVDSESISEVVSDTEYSCACDAGYFGTNCEFGPCDSITCENGGTEVLFGSICNCNCPDGYSGPNCEAGDVYLILIEREFRLYDAFQVPKCTMRTIQCWNW